jgi:hypothetical protein
MADIASLVAQTSVSTGTGDFTLVAVNGRQSFDGAFGNGSTEDAFYYFISNREAVEWEVGTGHMSDAATLSRDTVLRSSNSDEAVDFTAGTKDVANDIPASAQVRRDEAVLQAVLTTRGDILRRGEDEAERLALGTTGHVYQSDGTDVVTGQLTAAAFPTGSPVITTAMISAVDTDGALATNSDSKLASQKAVKTYADTKLPLAGGTMTGNIAMSGSQTVDGRDLSTDGAKLDGIEAGADVTDAGNVGSTIHGATGKSTPVDADELGLIDSAASNVLKKLTWANLKATLKTYFDTLYQAAGSYLTASSTATLTNKRITARVGSTTSSTTPTINTDNYDVYRITALTGNITSMTTNLSGTPNHGDKLIVEITGTATRTIAWGSGFEDGATTLPTATVGTAMLSIGLIYNSATSKWRCMAAG